MSKFIKISKIYLDWKDGHCVEKYKPEELCLNLDSILSMYQYVQSEHAQYYLMETTGSTYYINEKDYQRILENTGVVSSEPSEDTTKPQQKTFPRGSIDKNMSKFIKVRSLYLESKFDNKTACYTTYINDVMSYDAFVNMDKIVYVGKDTSNEKNLYKLDCGDTILIISSEDYKRVLAHLDRVDDKIEDTTEPDIKTIPRSCIDNQLKWLARDGDGILYAYENKPTKGHGVWYDANAGYYEEILGDTFENVQWDDEEPTKIED